MIRARSTLVLLFTGQLFACGGDAEDRAAAVDLPRVAIAGIHIESSTFSPAQTTLDGFRVARGEEILASYPFLMWEGSPARERAVWLPTLRGRATPGGIVTRETYESMTEEILAGLEAVLPIDGLFFDIHGAMSVVGLDDPEADLLERIRVVIGSDVLVSTSMDLHGNVSERLALQTDLITAYRMAPHEDALESKERAVDNLLDRLEGGFGKPAYKAWIPVPILLPGEKTSTRVEPARSLYEAVDPITRRDGVIDAAIWMGYPWADEPRNHAVVMTYGDDADAVAQAAEELAAHFWRVRHQFEFVAPTTTLPEALETALSHRGPRPFMISDMGDNPTAGGAGDVTWTLARLLERPEFQASDGPNLIYASIPGPAVVEAALAVGEGGHVDALAGAIVDDRYAPPVRLEGTVEAIRQGDRAAEVEVVVRVGSLRVIVTQRRKPYHLESDFTNLGLDPRSADIVVVKIGYLVPELYEMRGDWLMALTPGGVDQDLARVPYERIQRPMIPLDPDMPDPDLSARMIPLANTAGVR
ncbi:MAG: M81 family metallopeptidase [Gemmatimonadota bacterium]